VRASDTRGDGGSGAAENYRLSHEIEIERDQYGGALQRRLLQRLVADGFVRRCMLQQKPRYGCNSRNWTIAATEYRQNAIIPYDYSTYAILPFRRCMRALSGS
jgi:hypothetical protein